MTLLRIQAASRSFAAVKSLIWAGGHKLPAVETAALRLPVAGSLGSRKDLAMAKRPDTGAIHPRGRLACILQPRPPILSRRRRRRNRPPRRGSVSRGGSTKSIPASPRFGGHREPLGAQSARTEAMNPNGPNRQKCGEGAMQSDP